MCASFHAMDCMARYYADNAPLRQLLVWHSMQVLQRAMQVCARHPELSLDISLLRDGCLLHDIGIFLTDAPSIGCHGSAPYLLHGKLGAELMRKEGREDLARICERHTGTGLTARQIAAQELPLPAEDLCPETREEQVVCYADKFFSKSHPEHTRTPKQVVKSLEKWGEEGVAKFLAWHALFG